MAASLNADRRGHPWRVPISLFFIACLAGIIVWAPAAWLRPALPNALACPDLTGTVWQGECRNAVRIDSFGSRSTLGHFRWKLSASSLLQLAIDAEVEWQLENLTARAEFRQQSDGHWRVRDLELVSDYQTLSLLADRDLRRLWLLVPRSQGIRLQIPLAFGNPKEIAHLQGELHFSAFGDHTLIIRPDERGELGSRGGPLQLTGALDWQRDGRYRLALKIRLNPDADVTLRSALASFGAANAQGDYDLTLEGSIWSLLR
ncbi:MAG: type II secretion system protein N [Steroidobacteraceae bacterium]